ncbi:hypothetical protein ACET6X_01065 [Aeromonas veronii]
MNIEIGMGCLFVAFIILYVYSSISYKVMRKPLVFVATGFILCIFSAFTISIYDSITPHVQTEDNKAIIDIIKNTFMLSIASLGGGLISSGLVNKAQIAHERHIKSQRERLGDIDARIQKIYNLIQENKDVWSQEEIDYHRQSAIRQELKKIMLSSKIEEDEY